MKLVIDIFLSYDYYQSRMIRIIVLLGVP